MPRPVALAECAMEVQSALADLGRSTRPLYEAAIASGRWDALAEAKTLSADIERAKRTAKRIAGLGEVVACPDSLTLGLGHGRAA